MFMSTFISCQEASVSCLSEQECDLEQTCVAGQCLGAELEDRDPFTYYKEEMHYRLTAECGICHAAADQSEMPPVVTPQMEDNNKDPYRLPTYTAAPGDSGWRIFIDDLNEEKFLASYLDTMQYINITAPEESLLFAFGRGEVGISQEAKHPKLYTTRQELDELNQGETLYKTAPIGYERLVNWARLSHIHPDVIRYNLEEYLELALPALSGRCGGCHNGSPTLKPDERIPRGGFAYLLEATDPADLAPLSGLINLDEPAQSAIIRLFIGEYDHPNIPMNLEALAPFEEALIPWIESLRR